VLQLGATLFVCGEGSLDRPVLLRVYPFVVVHVERVHMPAFFSARSSVDPTSQTNKQVSTCIG
jgi:hypothetical protein